MSSDYSYDKDGDFWPYYIIVISGFITLPLTYSLLRPSSNPLARAPKISTAFKPEHVVTIEKQRIASRRKPLRLGPILVALLGWAAIGYMAYLIANSTIKTTKLYDPYEILGISQSATEKEIKSAFKRMSLKFHPDKIRIDPAKNESAESVNARYVDLNKAYQALTDEEIRNNWINFGNPDGKQSFSYGIGLPSFLVNNKIATRAVIIIYCVMFFNVLPYVVGSWWYGVQRVSKDGVLMESANNMFGEYKEDIDEGGVITALSIAKEFECHVKGKDKSHLSKVESKILAEGDVGPVAGGLSTKDKASLQDMNSTNRRKALGLLWAYLSRTDLDDATLNALKYKVAPIAHDVAKSFLSISLAYGNTAPILATFRAAQHLVQAIPPMASPLLQLPHFTPKVVRAVEGDSRIHYTIQRFMDLPDAERRRLAVGPGLLTEEEYGTALEISRQLPYFRVAKAFFKVAGERFIIPSSLVSLVVKGRFVPPGTENVPEVNETDLEDIDPAEDDLDAILGRKKKKGKKADGKDAGGDDAPALPPMSFAPYYTRNHSPKWSVFLTDSKQGKMAVPPFSFSAFDTQIATPDGKPSLSMQTMKAQFQAPPQPGNYTFVMHVICDGYVGFDTKMEVTMHVEPASKVAQMKVEDDISEPERDSLAGQMRALKRGDMRREKSLSSESDDESGTDDDEEDTSETNTDTEDES